LRAILIQAKRFGFTPVRQEIKEAELTVKGEKVDIGRSLVVFLAVEEDDDEAKAVLMASQVASDAKEIGENKIVIYPFVHLTEKPLEPSKSIELIKKVATTLRGEGFEVRRAPFGWTKGFYIEVMSHPLAERGVRIREPPLEVQPGARSRQDRLKLA